MKPSLSPQGSVRNRLAEEQDEVLLDENYLHHIVDNPVYLRPHSKTFLREAVNCDTAFLAAQSIIDYSLLVGMSGDRIVVGIIDYIRKFTFDKKVGFRRVDYFVFICLLCMICVLLVNYGIGLSYTIVY